MSDEHDSWFKDAFDVDLGQAVQGLKDEASAVVDQVSSTVTQVVQGVQGAVEGVLDEATGAAAGIAKKVAGAVSPAGAGGASGASGANGGIGSFPLGGSVGRGGKNAANDVRAVQTALGIAADGQCGGQTIAAIEAFQRTTMGVAQPDGRVDAGGSTERELTGDGGKSPEPLPPVGDVAGGPFGALQAGAKALAGAGSGAAVGVVGTATALATGVVAAAGSALSGDGGAEGLFASDVDVRQATPGDASSALPLMAAMGSPVPLPMPDPEGPVSGVRLIEKGAKAVGEAAVGIGAGALAVGLAAGAAVLTWSSKTAPPWMDEMNPKTGKPYKDEDEWKAVKERQEKQQRGGGRQPHSGPLVAPDDPDAKPQAPTCSTMFPTIPICSSSMNGYGSMDEEAKAQPQYEQAVRQNVTTMSEYQGIPGGENSHATYYDSGGNKLFALINRSCCIDTDAGPILQWRWVVA